MEAFGVGIIAIGLIQALVALLAPDKLRAYPGSTATRQQLGLTGAGLQVIVGVALVTFA